jgi:hypothetical protein
MQCNTTLFEEDHLIPLGLLIPSATPPSPYENLCFVSQNREERVRDHQSPRGGEEEGGREEVREEGNSRNFHRLKQNEKQRSMKSSAKDMARAFSLAVHLLVVLSMTAVASNEKEEGWPADEGWGAVSMKSLCRAGWPSPACDERGDESDGVQIRDQGGGRAASLGKEQRVNGERGDVGSIRDACRGGSCRHRAADQGDEVGGDGDGGGEIVGGRGGRGGGNHGDGGSSGGGGSLFELIITEPRRGSVLRGDAWLTYDILDLSSSSPTSQSHADAQSAAGARHGSDGGEGSLKGLHKGGGKEEEVEGKMEGAVRVLLTVAGCGLRIAGEASRHSHRTLSGRIALPPLSPICGQGNKTIVLGVDSGGVAGSEPAPASLQVQVAPLPTIFQIDSPGQGDILHLSSLEGSENLLFRLQVYQAGADAWPVNATLSLALKSTNFPWYRPALHSTQKPPLMPHCTRFRSWTWPCHPRPDRSNRKGAYNRNHHRCRLASLCR